MVITELNGLLPAAEKRRLESFRPHDIKEISSQQMDSQIQNIDVPLKKRLDESYSREDNVILRIENLRRDLVGS